MHNKNAANNEVYNFINEFYKKTGSVSAILYILQKERNIKEDKEKLRGVG